MKYEYIFLQEVDSILIKKLHFKYKIILRNIIITISAVYSKYKDKKYCNIQLDLVNRKIKLSKLEWIDIKNKEFIPRSIIEIALDIKKLLTLSDGITIDNNRYIEKYEKKIV